MTSRNSLRLFPALEEPRKRTLTVVHAVSVRNGFVAMSCTEV